MKIIISFTPFSYLIRIVFVFFISFITIVECIAQPAIELQEYQEKYPGVNAVILNEEVELHFEIVDGKLNIYEDKYEETFYLSEMASYFKDEELGYTSFNTLSNIEASTLTPGTKKYKTLKVKEFKDKDDLSSSIFHDDTRFTTFTYEGLQKGAKTKLSYRSNYKDEHLIGKEFLQSYLPIISKSYTIVADENIEIAYKAYNLDKANVAFRQSKEDGKNIYTWEVKQVKELESESWAPGISWYSPHVIPYIKSYTINGVKKNVFRNTEDLFQWYSEITSGVNNSFEDPEIQSLVDSITAGAVDELDKVRKIFYWTQDNIKYIAIEYGMGGFVPRDVAYICENRYGDCKDMASTITTLLAYADVESYLTWIGTNKIPYRYSDVPTPVVDNHMIATYIDKDGEYYFLDATGRYYAFGIPSSFIQGKEALIKKGLDEFEVVEVPRVEAEDNVISEKIYLKMEGVNILGNSITQISGYQKANFEYQIENLNKEEKLQFYKSYFSKGSNKFLPDNFSEENLYPIENPLKVKYDFSIDDYVMVNGDEKYINMNLENTVLGQKIEEEREIPVQNKYSIAYENENTLEIPSGWTVDYVPQDLKIENDYIQYLSRYELKENKLILHQHTRISFLNMEKEHFNLWNKNVNEIKKNQNEIVIIKQNHD